MKKENLNAKKTETTELVFILDRSGSMSGLEGDTIGGFNAMIEKQKKEKGECCVSTVLFSTTSRVLQDRLALADIPKMTEADYYVGGMTALVDAVGNAISHIKTVHAHLGKTNVPQHTLFVIMTDGLENASKEYTSAQIKSMIEQQKECGWEFLFIGANIDAVKTAGTYGISQNRAANYCADKAGTNTVYNSLSDTVSAVRKSCSITDEWKKDIEADQKNRKK